MSTPADLPPLLGVVETRARLCTIFPEGAPDRNCCVRELAARTVFVLLYAGATEGTDRWLRPDQVTRMTDRQSKTRTTAARLEWASGSLSRRNTAIRGRWYAQNTRESIRDETLRYGLMQSGAVIERQGLPTTSSAPRYALAADFVALFAPELSGAAWRTAVVAWQEKHLSPGALARVRLMRNAVVASPDQIPVRFPIILLRDGTQQPFKRLYELMA